MRVRQEAVPETVYKEKRVMAILANARFYSFSVFKYEPVGTLTLPTSSIKRSSSTEARLEE